MQTSELTAAEVVARVRPYVAKMTVGDVTFCLDEAGIYSKGKYWNLPVRPTRYPENRHLYLEALANLEVEINEKEGFCPLIVDGRPLDEDEDPLLYRSGNFANGAYRSYEEKSQASLKMTAAEVAARLRPYVAKITFDDITFCVAESGIYLRFDYWHVPIRPSRETEHRSRYAEALVDLEIEAQDCEGFHFVIDSRDALTDE